MILEDSLEVFLDSRCAGEDTPEAIHVGSLRGSFQGASRVLGGVRFEYSNDYLTHERRISLSPALPLVTGPQYLEVDGALPDVFSDTAPDDWGQSVIIEQVSRTAPGLQIGDFDFLALTRDSTRMGALRFQNSAGIWLAPPSTPNTETVDVDELARAAQRFERWEATEEDMVLLGVAGSTLGGARPKVTFEQGGKTWILKLPSNRDQNTDTEAWEATALDLAERSGIRTPERRLIQGISGGSALQLARFDRDGARRLHYISAMTALGAGTGSRETYEDLVDVLDGLGTPREDLAELFVRVALNVLVSNRDDHWRNHGFIFDAGWRLSPVFDVNPVRRSSPILSRRIDTRDNPGDRNIKFLLDGCDAYALTKPQAAQSLVPILEVFPRWREIAECRGIQKPEIESMSSAFRDDQYEVMRSFVAKHSQ